MAERFGDPLTRTAFGITSQVKMHVWCRTFMQYQPYVLDSLKLQDVPERKNRCSAIESMR